MDGCMAHLSTEEVLQEELERSGEASRRPAAGRTAAAPPAGTDQCPPGSALRWVSGGLVSWLVR